MLTTELIDQWIIHPSQLDGESLNALRSVLARYPFFHTARLLFLQNLFGVRDPSFGAELRKATLYIVDRRILFNLIHGDVLAPLTEVLLPEEAAAEETAEQQSAPMLDRSLQLIDSFLATQPEQRKDWLEFDAVSDYTAYMVKAEDAPKKEENCSINGSEQETSPVVEEATASTTATSVSASPEPAEQDTSQLNGHELIDKFIDSSPTFTLDSSPESLSAQEADKSTYLEELTANNFEEEECFTETLAKIYIRQEKYSRAIEIFKKLCLKYPKKSAYFADQIRFLEKLIINTKSK
ncbi:MAG: tetratricopeptide repeat protein [Bacteroidaceae bacterium]|nr:tetratricopeptide repeat protein [Bacteroidaceae bacterium]